MTKPLLSILGALALTTSLAAQQPSPATQPVRPPERPSSGEPQPPLRAPVPDLGDRKKGSGDGESDRTGEPDAGTMTLKGCLQRVGSSGYRLHPMEGDDATVTADVRLLTRDETPLALGRVVDMSLHGLRVDLGLKIDEGFPVTVAFDVDGEEPLRIDGQIRWAHPMPRAPPRAAPPTRHR